MPHDAPASGSRPPHEREDSAETVQALRRRVEELEQARRDLEVMLENATAHADHLAESLEAERNDLATMLELATEHADTVEDELHEQAAETILKSARELRMIVEATPAPVLISRVDDGEIVYANAMADSLFRSEPNALLKTSIRDLYSDAADREALVRRLERERSIDREEIRLLRPDGTMIWVEVSLRMLEFNDAPSILSALHDITARKESEQRLQQQVEALRLELEETSSDAQIARTTGTTRFENLDATTIRRGTTRLVAVHSFRGGNGKSSITANVAALLAVAGQRVGVVDADLQSPGVHLLLGRNGANPARTLNDFLMGNCEIDQLSIDVTGELGSAVSGRVFLIPASVNPGAMAQVLSQGYESRRLTQCFHELGESLGLDTLLIDTHPGMNEEALLAMRAAQTLVVVLRPDALDFEGTGITVQVARQLEVARLVLVVNQVSDMSGLHALRSRVQQTFGSEVTAIVPQSAEFSTTGEATPFVLRHPTHPITLALQRVAQATYAVTS